MKIKRPMMFLEPADPNASGGSDDGTSAPASATRDPWSHNGDDDGGDTSSGTTAPAIVAPVTPPTPAPVTIDPSAFDAFGKSFAKTFLETQQQSQAQAPATPPTPEQIAEARKALAFFEVDDNFVKDFGNLETQKAALERFRDGITKHIVTVVNHLRGSDRTELEKTFTERLSPVESLLAERQSAERQSRFNSRFTQFAAPELAPAVESVISQLASRKAFEGKSEADAFKLVAETLAQQAKAFNPNFVLEDVSASGSASPTPSGRQGNSIPVTSGGSGASRSGNNAPAKKGWALAHLK